MIGRSFLEVRCRNLGSCVHFWTTKRGDGATNATRSSRALEVSSASIARWRSRVSFSMQRALCLGQWAAQWLSRVSRKYERLSNFFFSFSFYASSAWLAVCEHLRSSSQASQRVSVEATETFFYCGKVGIPGCMKTHRVLRYVRTLQKVGIPGGMVFSAVLRYAPFLIFSIASLINHTFPAHGIGLASECQGTWGRVHAHWLTSIHAGSQEMGSDGF